MTFYIDPDGSGGGRRKPKLRDAEGERLQKLENATFVARELGRFSKTLDDDFAQRAKAGGARGAAFSEDIKHRGLGLIDDTLAGIDSLPDGRLRIDEAARKSFRERAREVLDLKLTEGRVLQVRQAERDALGALSSVGRELSDVAGRRPDDFAALREHLGRAVDEFSGVFGPEREAAIRRELDDDLLLAKLTGMAASDLDAALAELNEPANLPGQDEEAREKLRARLRMTAAAAREDPGLAELARQGEERRVQMTETARLDAALSTAESVGTRDAIRQARDVLRATIAGGRLTQPRIDAALARLAEREAVLIAREGRIARIEALLAEGGRPDPGSPDDRRAVDEHYAAYRESIAGLPEPGRILAQAAYGGRVGMIPAPLADEIEGGGLLAREPEVQAEAARRFALVEDRLPAPCPEGVFTFVPCERARELARFERMGVAPERAVELTDLLFRPGDEAEVRALPFRPGNGNAREFLRPVAAGRRTEIAETEPVGDSEDTAQHSEGQEREQDDGQSPEAATASTPEEPAEDGENGHFALDPALEAEIARQLAGDESRLTGPGTGAEPEAVKAIEDLRRLNEQGLGKLLPQESRDALKIVADALPSGEEAALLALSVLPGSGDVLVVQDLNAVANRLAAALGEGDMEAAGAIAPEYFAAIIGAIPLIGPLFRGGRRAGELAQDVVKRIETARAQRFEATPGEDGAARIEAIRNDAEAKRPKGTFDQSPVEAFQGTKFPPESPEENVLRGLAAADIAMLDALRGGPGAVVKAMHREDVGAVSFYWGKPGDPTNVATPYKGGFGLSHIVAKHGPEVVDDVVEAIAKGELRFVNVDKTRVALSLGDTEAILSLDRSGEKNVWLLTGFRIGEGNDVRFDLSAIQRPMFFE